MFITAERASAKRMLSFAFLLAKIHCVPKIYKAELVNATRFLASSFICSPGLRRGRRKGQKCFLQNWSLFTFSSVYPRLKI